MQLAQSNHYAVLGLPTPTSADDPLVTSEILKKAYRRALLQHHPDRKTSGKPTEQFTVDQIIEAYETLADHTSRVKYHETLSKQRSGHIVGKSTERSAIETFDLEDLEYTDPSQGGLWERQCRCGSKYQVDEKQLNDAAIDGEIVVSCPGCSLTIKVVFDAVEE